MYIYIYVHFKHIWLADARYFCAVIIGEMCVIQMHVPWVHFDHALLWSLFDNQKQNRMYCTYCRTRSFYHTHPSALMTLVFTSSCSKSLIRICTPSWPSSEAYLVERCQILLCSHHPNKMYCTYCGTTCLYSTNLTTELLEISIYILV